MECLVIDFKRKSILINDFDFVLFQISFPCKSVNKSGLVYTVGEAREVDFGYGINILYKKYLLFVYLVEVHVTFHLQLSLFLLLLLLVGKWS
jgi:hypothetical protein